MLGAVLTLAGSTADLTRGVVLLAAYSLGLGLPFLALALSLHRVPGWLRGLGRGAVALQGVSGLLLVAMCILLVTDRWLPLISLVLAWYAQVCRLPWLRHLVTRLGRTRGAGPEAIKAPRLAVPHRDRVGLFAWPALATMPSNQLLSARPGTCRDAFSSARVVFHAYHVLSRREPYRDLGANYFPDRKSDAHRDRLIRQLEPLGYQVSLTSAA